jgi:hypothetical protein
MPVYDDGEYLLVISMVTSAKQLTRHTFVSPWYSTATADKTLPE